jgi:hypothetical protein
LSIPIKANPIMFITRKYPIVKITEFIDYLLFSTSCIFIARTLEESPKRLMKPSAS